MGGNLVRNAARAPADSILKTTSLRFVGPFYGSYHNLIFDVFINSIYWQVILNKWPEEVEYVIIFFRVLQLTSNERSGINNKTNSVSRIEM